MQLHVPWLGSILLVAFQTRHPIPTSFTCRPLGRGHPQDLAFPIRALRSETNVPR